VFATGNCKVEAHDKAIVLARENSTVDGSDEVEIKCYGDSQIHATGKCVIDAYDKAIVTASPSCTVEKHDEAKLTRTKG
jgi:hypothetical protein